MEATLVTAVPTGPRVRARNRKGRCFELAGKGQWRDPSWTLVHGSIFGWIAHAWLVKDGMVYDAVGDQFMSERDYQEQYQSVIERSYQWKEAAMFLADSPHWGPWHKTSASFGART